MTNTERIVLCNEIINRLKKITDECEKLRIKTPNRDNFYDWLVGKQTGIKDAIDIINECYPNFSEQITPEIERLIDNEMQQ